MIAAFVYETYYMWEIKKNFRGIYDDFDQLKEMLRGSREYSNLETLDLETLEFQRFYWKPYYEVEKAKEITTDSHNQELDNVLIKRWTRPGQEEKIPFTYKYLENTTNSGVAQKYYSGFWSDSPDE